MSIRPTTTTVTTIATTTRDRQFTNIWKDIEHISQRYCVCSFFQIFNENITQM